MAVGGSRSARLHSFVGREDELAELRDLLESGRRLITLVAPGGYGKSRLVSRFCQQSAAGFRDGVVEVLLAAVSDPDRIAAATAEALDIQLRGNHDPERQLFDYLRRRQLLLHFDNFEHLVEGAGFVSELLERAPGVTVLISSREALGLPGEVEYRLEPLPTESANGVWDQRKYSAASRLFADRAALVDSQFVLDEQTAAHVEQICSDLDGVPLAIELAAAWTDTYGLPELHRGLHWQIDLAARSDDVPQRHRSVRASCEWSYQLLNDGQQLLLRTVAFFAGGFFIDSVRRLLPLPNLHDELEALERKSWLRSAEALGQTRYYMHNQAIREYAFQKLLDSDDYEVVATGHCRYFGDLLTTQAAALWTRRQIEASRQLTLELDNVLAAATTAVARGERELLAPFVQNLDEYLLRVGGARLCLARYREFMKAGADLGAEKFVIKALLAQAAASVDIGNYEQARGLAAEAAGLLGDSGDPAARARCSTILALVERFEGNHAQARYQFNIALSLLRELGDSLGVAGVLQGLGQVEMVESNYDTARTLIRESAELRRAAGDEHGVAACLNDLGNMEYRQGQYAEARKLHSESLNLRRRMGDRRGIGQSLSNLGNVEFSEGEFGEAWTLYSESLEIRRGIGERFGIAVSLNNLGNVQYCEGNFEEARKLHEEGLVIKREIGDRIGASYSLNNLGNISIRLADYRRAGTQLAEALLIASELSSAECMLAALANSCCLLASTGNSRPARMLYWAVHNLLVLEGQVLDPMDGGMLEEGGRLALAPLAAGEDEELRADAISLSLSGAVSLALKEL